MRLALGGIVLNNLESAFREVRDFIAAKRIKRERIRYGATGVAAASYKPRSRQDFTRFRRLLRDNWHLRFSEEKLASLEHALQKRCGFPLPVPRDADQNPDCSVTLFWEGITVMLRREGIAYLLGGTAGAIAKGITRDLLNALEFQARLQQRI